MGAESWDGARRVRASRWLRGVGLSVRIAPLFLQEPTVEEPFALEPSTDHFDMVTILHSCG